MREPAPTKKCGDSKNEYVAWGIVSGGTGYRLLREVEWEYACRAGTQTEFSSGNDESLLVAYCQIFPSTLPAICGQKLPNAWGVYDMHGNVWEWCGDEHNAHDSGNGAIRGGSYGCSAVDMRSAHRLTLARYNRGSTDGFRVSRTLPPVPFTALTPAEGSAENEN